MNKDLMRKAGFGKTVDAVDAGLCPFCGKGVDENDFRDALSLREFRISGLCQTPYLDRFGKGAVLLE